MPIVRLDLPAATPDAVIAEVADAVHQALVAAFDVPLDDRFQTVARRAEDELVYPAEFLGVAHGSRLLVLQITCAPGRSVERKRALFAQIAQRVADQGHFAASDVIVSLVESARENWSFGNGLAQFAPA